MKVTDASSIRLAKRVEKWAKIVVELGLAHWRIECITLTDQMPNDGDGKGSANASIFVASTYDSMHIYFRNSFLEEADDHKIDEVIVHELLHAAMRDLDEAINAAEDFLSSASQAIWSERVDDARERLIENLARLIVRLHRGDKPRFTP